MSEKKPTRIKAEQTQARDLSQYDAVILEVFLNHYQENTDRLVFRKDELADACIKYEITVRNIPDIIYTYRSRRNLPTRILTTGQWAIEPAGRGAYAFRLLQNAPHFDIPFSDYCHFA
jgi:hypothetical protein